MLVVDERHVDLRVVLSLPGRDLDVELRPDLAGEVLVVRLLHVVEDDAHAERVAGPDLLI